LGEEDGVKFENLGRGIREKRMKSIRKRGDEVHSI